MTRKLLGVYVLAAVLAVLVLPGNVASQDCESTDGSPRQCTVMEAYDLCMEAAVDAADQRAAEGRGNFVTRAIEFTIDSTACTAAVFVPFV